MWIYFILYHEVLNTSKNVLTNTNNFKEYILVLSLKYFTKDLDY